MFDGRNSLTIAPEDFETFWHDAQPLFALHRAEAGYDGEIDLDLLRLLDQRRMVLAVTARAHGEIVGYVTFLIAPSLDDRGKIFAEQKVYFVRRDYRGIGVKMRAVAKDELRRRGIASILAVSGVRAGGPKQAALFKREGGRYVGALYSIPLEN